MSQLLPVAASPATLAAQGSQASEPGIHLLCIGISSYADAPLSSAAASALGVFGAFLRLAEDATLPLPMKSARLAVAPSAAETALVKVQKPEQAELFAAARERLERTDLDRLLNEWFERVRTRPEDVAVFYFAGHGLGEDESPDQESKTLLLASDFEDEFRRPPRAVAVQHLFSALHPASSQDPVARSQLFLFDCCRERTWAGPPAQQGDLMISVADRLRSDRRAHDDRRVAVDYACFAGDRAWSQSSDAERGILALTNYASALVSALERSHALPELRAHELLRRIEALLLERYQQQTRHGRCDDFPLRVLPPGVPRPADAPLLAARGPRIDSRAPTELAGWDGARVGLGPAEALSPQPAHEPARSPAASAVLVAPAQKRHRAWVVPAGLAACSIALVAALRPTRQPEVVGPPPSSSALQTAAPAAEPSALARPAGVVLSASALLGPFDFLAGSSVAEARAAYASCLAYSARGAAGAAPASALPCSKPFEASAYVRETWLNGQHRGPAFYLDRVEVTWEKLSLWLNATRSELVINDAPAEGVPWVAFPKGSPLVAIRSSRSRRRESKLVFDGAAFRVEESDAKLPAAFVSWAAASAYCQAHHQRLPTELEWELAARGAARRNWPWSSDDPPDCAKVSFGRAKGQPCAERGAAPSMVGASPGDVTPEGLFDLAGNVLEWTSDSYASPVGESGCSGPGGCKVVRGGSFLDDAPLLRSASRGRLPPSTLAPNLGFRCAKEAP